jgi:hypothetical protein
MAYTFDSTLGDLLNDPKAKTILDKYLPGVSTNPMIGMAKGISLKMILSMPQVTQMGITQQKVQTVLDEINKLP